MTAEELFESVGFVKEYYVQMSEFYRDNFESERDMISFFVKVFQNDDKDKTPRRMMNQIQHLVSIANDIDQIRPGRDPLRIFFIKTCLEALCALSGMKKPGFYEGFPSYMSDEGKAYILENFLLTGFEDVYMNHQYEACHELTIDDFFEIIKAVRDIVAHEGNYWEMHIRDLIYGLLDCSMALLLLLPFFGQKVNGVIQEVSLLALTEIQLYLKILYLVIVIGMTALGILTLALRNCNCTFWIQNKSKVSLLANAIGVFLFIMSQQPYAAVFVFAFLIIKALMLIKR